MVAAGDRVEFTRDARHSEGLVRAGQTGVVVASDGEVTIWLDTPNLESGQEFVEWTRMPKGLRVRKSRPKRCSNMCASELESARWERLPRASDTAGLGTVLELEHALPQDNIVRHSWPINRAPRLYWSEQRQALYIFPALAIVPEFEPITESERRSNRAAGAFRRWTGRHAKYKYRVRVPDLRVRRAGQGIHIVYHSDKWGSPTTYYHPFERGVMVSVGPGHEPSALWIRGGNLRLTERGLEG